MQVNLKETLESQSALKNCSTCGRRFGCGFGDASCWCNDFPTLPPEKLDVNQDCVCPECLNQALQTTPGS